jgi:hypothetical protein
MRWMRKIDAQLAWRTLAFSCGARKAFKLKERDYLRSMLSRRQLQGFVMPRCDCTTNLISNFRCQEPQASGNEHDLPAES